MFPFEIVFVETVFNYEDFQTETPYRSTNITQSLVLTTLGEEAF